MLGKNQHHGRTDSVKTVYPHTHRVFEEGWGWGGGGGGGGGSNNVSVLVC